MANNRPMTEDEKKLLQAQHRMEAIEARNRQKERKARTRRLIQMGAVLESVFPEVQTMELDDVKMELKKTIEGISLGSFAAIPKGRTLLTTHKMGGGIPFGVVRSARLCGSVGALCTMPHLLSLSTQFPQITNDTAFGNQGYKLVPYLALTACENLPLHKVRPSGAAVYRRDRRSIHRTYFLFQKKQKLCCGTGRRKIVNYFQLEAKVVSRVAGRSVIAAAAYASCSRLYNDYDGLTHDYTRKHGCLYSEVFLPQYAPEEWKDRQLLWEAVESVEKTKDSRLARELVVALPSELSLDDWKSMLKRFVREQGIDLGMCADVNIHDPYPPGHNPPQPYSFHHASLR